MGKCETRLLWVLIFSIIVAAAPTGALAQQEPPFQSPSNYRGCLRAKGKLSKLIRGLEPVRRCKQSEVEIGLAAADVVDLLIVRSNTVIDLAEGLDTRLSDVEAIADKLEADTAAALTQVQDTLAEIVDKVDGTIFLSDLNTAVGRNTLTGTGGIDNTAFGASALRNMTGTGIGNTGVGKDALRNTVGPFGLDNTGIGRRALRDNQAGHDNVAVGAGALIASEGSGNIAIGSGAGSALRNGDDNIYIANNGIEPENDTIRIGDDHQKTFIAGIAGTNVAGGVPVVVAGDGQLGVEMSSRRYKKDIRPLGELSHDLMRLRPVAYRYKEPNAERKQPLQYGLIAEEVAQVYPELVAYSEDGRVQTVKYHKLNSMLLNELQKQHKQMRQQEEIIAKLVTRLARVEAKLAN